MTSKVDRMLFDISIEGTSSAGQLHKERARLMAMMQHVHMKQQSPDSTTVSHTFVNAVKEVC